MKSKKNAFTLIELLAIIVILAIIAVITVPIILNIIDNSKKGAATDSAYGYKDAVNKTYVQELAKPNNENLKLAGTYLVQNDGTLNADTGSNFGVTNYTNLPVSVSGDKPSGGYLNYSNNSLTGGCLVFGDYAVTFDGGNAIKTEKGDCSTSDNTDEPIVSTKDARQTLIVKSQNDETGNEPVAVSHAATEQTAATTDYRYMGATPNNYIYFNCSSYDEKAQNDENCETWRIIGIVDGKIKLIKSDALGHMQWDQQDEGYAYNDWSRAKLKTFLNEDYYNSTEAFSENEDVEEGQRALTLETRGLISPSTWYFGGFSPEFKEENYSYPFNVSAEEAYHLERGEITFSCSSSDQESYENELEYFENGGEGTFSYAYCAPRSEKIENTLVGLIYPSDYGFASSSCYNDSDKKMTYPTYNSCKSSNWLYDIIAHNYGSAWTISSIYYEHDYSSAMFFSNGELNDYHEDCWIENYYDVYPTVYLDSNVELVGNGTNLSPYKIIK